MSNLILPTLISATSRWLVVSKPAGWLTIPGRSECPVLSDWVKTQYGPIWIVHRLDVETSGIVLFARSAQDHREASQWFEKRQVKKTYFSLAGGKPASPVFKVKEPIQGAASLTQIEVQEVFFAGFLARVFPQTGRRHQIRIHLANRGHPIWGDSQYGGSHQVALCEEAGQVLEIPRVALHAGQLELPTREVFMAEFQEDFSGWLKKLRDQK